MLKRALVVFLSGLGLTVLAGCPIYPSDHSYRECIGGTCYSCPADHYSSDCNAWVCNDNSGCPSEYACNASQRCEFTNQTTNVQPSTTCTKPSDCTTGTCGSDDRCHADTCQNVGCPSDYVCHLASGSGGTPKCEPIGRDGGGTASTCKSDKDCTTAPGSKCLTGTCVEPANQCADTTQCTNDAQCVSGACTPSCSDTKACPTGYACDTAKHVCTNNPTPCTTSTSCDNGKLCVEEHCVDPCGDGATCGAGLKCVDGGCTPDEQPVFVCNADGQRDTCQSGSICLRHSCYIGCDADAGATACKAADKFNQCKGVTTANGTYDVCGSTDNLGTDCDPTRAKNCADPLVCIDGFCK